MSAGQTLKSMAANGKPSFREEVEKASSWHFGNRMVASVFFSKADAELMVRW